MCYMYISNIILNSIILCINEKYASEKSSAIFNNKKHQKIWRTAFVACIIFTAYCAHYAGLWGYSTVDNDREKAALAAAICFIFVFIIICVLSYGIGKVIKWIIE